MNSKLYKLAKMIINLAEVSTDKGTLVCDGELEIGKEIFVLDANEELVKPEDGEYASDEKIIVIADGLVAEIRDKELEVAPEPEPEPEQTEIEQEEQEPEPEPEPDERDSRIAELEALVAELNNIIVEKDEEIGRLRAELEKSDAEPAEEQLKSQKPENSWSYKPRF